MKPASYAVVRCIPDLARGEAFNVGIIIWDDERWNYKLDQKAIDRVVTQCPDLARDGIRGLSGVLASRLRLPGQYDKTAFSERASRLCDTFLSVTEARAVGLTGPGPKELDLALDRLIKRIVTPRQRQTGRGFDPFKALAVRLKPQVKAHIIETDHPFSQTRSGVERHVNYFTNSTVNTAMDVLSLDLAKERSLVERIDAEAFKVEDVLASNRISFAVYCWVPEVRDRGAKLERACKILGSAGAKVVTGLEDAAVAIGSKDS